MEIFGVQNIAALDDGMIPRNKMQTYVFCDLFEHYYFCLLVYGFSITLIWFHILVLETLQICDTDPTDRNEIYVFCSFGVAQGEVEREGSWERGETREREGNKEGERTWEKEEEVNFIAKIFNFQE